MTPATRVLTVLLMTGVMFEFPLMTASAQDAAGNRFQIPPSDEGLPGSGPIRRYDWFQNLWTNRRSMWAEQVQQDQGALIFLGDSITQGWGPDMRNNFPDIKVANRGISGDTTRGVLIRLEEDVIAVNPQGVALLIGTNDLDEQGTPEQIAGNVKLIIEKLHEADPEMPIVLSEVFPSSAEKNRPTEKIQDINRRYREIAENDPQVYLVETFALFANDQGDAKPEEFPDLLHPNQIGYEKWRAELAPIFEELGFGKKSEGASESKE